MKKMIIFVIAAAGLMASCNNVAWPTQDPEMSFAGYPDTAMFPFESTTGNFSNTAVTDNISFTSMALSGDKAYKGNSCLKVMAAFTGSTNERGGVISQSGTTIDMAGKTLTAYVWVPNGMFSTSNPYGATFFIQLANYDWYQSTWQNLELPSGNIPGIWNKISFYVNDMTLANGNGTAGHINGDTVSQNGANVNAQYVWGFKIGMGDVSEPYSGIMYIDSITVE